MKIIKFRGKDIETGKWVYGDLHVLCNRPHIHTEQTAYPYAGKRSFVALETIGQFTGLIDKNGKEIYEGDILLWTRKNVHIEGRPLQDFSDKCIVYYDSDKCAFKFRCELRYGACVGYLDFDDERADESFVEVIGNIYDNPELLEKGGNDETK